MDRAIRHRFRPTLLMAQGGLRQMVARTATTLVPGDVFRLMAWMFIAALRLVPCCHTAAQAPAAPLDTR